MYTLHNFFWKCSMWTYNTTLIYFPKTVQIISSERFRKTFLAALNGPFTWAFLNRDIYFLQFEILLSAALLNQSRLDSIKTVVQEPLKPPIVHQEHLVVSLVSELLYTLLTYEDALYVHKHSIFWELIFTSSSVSVRRLSMSQISRWKAISVVFLSLSNDHCHLVTQA